MAVWSYNYGTMYYTEYDPRMIMTQAWDAARDAAAFWGSRVDDPDYAKPSSYIRQTIADTWANWKEQVERNRRALELMGWVRGKLESDIQYLQSTVWGDNGEHKGRVSRVLESALVTIRGYDTETLIKAGIYALRHRHRLETDFRGAQGVDEYASDGYEMEQQKKYEQVALDMVALISTTSGGKWQAAIRTRTYKA